MFIAFGLVLVARAALYQKKSLRRQLLCAVELLTAKLLLEATVLKLAVVASCSSPWKIEVLQHEKGAGVDKSRSRQDLRPAQQI